MTAVGVHDRRFLGLTAIDFVPVAELQHCAVRLGFDYWQRQRGARKFPARAQIRPNEIVSALSHFSLIKVWDGGADFEVRIAGDAMNCAYRAPLNGRLISDIATDLPLMATRSGATSSVKLSRRDRPWRCARTPAMTCRKPISPTAKLCSCRSAKATTPSTTCYCLPSTNGAPARRPAAGPAVLRPCLPPMVVMA